MKKYTMEEINEMTTAWLNGNDEKSKRAWKRIFKDIENKQK